MAGTYTKLCYHIVFSTKNRAGYITPAIEDELHKYLGGIVHGLGGLSVEVNGMSDHVHMLAILPAEDRGVGCAPGDQNELVEVGSRVQTQPCHVRLAGRVRRVYGEPLAS